MRRQLFRGRPPRSLVTTSASPRRARRPYGCGSASGRGQWTSVAQPSRSNHADQPGRRVALPREHPVPGRPGEGVVAVVPRLAHRHDGKGTDVGALIAGAERPTAERVADRVDAPRDVVQHQDANAAGPDQGREGRTERAADAASRGRTGWRATGRTRAGTARSRRRCRGRPGGRARDAPTTCGCGWSSQPTCACHKPRSWAPRAGTEAVG